MADPFAIDPREEDFGEEDHEDNLPARIQRRPVRTARAASLTAGADGAAASGSETDDFTPGPDATLADATEDQAPQAFDATLTEAVSPRSAAAAPGLQPAQKREIDDGVLAILREEADLEAEARRIEASRSARNRSAAEAEMQVQPDLGVDSQPLPPPVLTPAQKRLAMLRGEDMDEDPPPQSPRAPARRDLLPDVEELTSTLQPEDGSYDPDREVENLPDLTRSGSFRSGFMMTLALLMLAAGLYVAADPLKDSFPALAPALDQFVSSVDALRLWLDGVMEAATLALKGEAGA